MKVSIKRDGLTLRGELVRPKKKLFQKKPKEPLVILFHGFTGNKGNSEEDLLYMMAEELKERGIASLRFDFNGHGESDGELSAMNMFNEIEDAIAILDYAKTLDFPDSICLLGHSQGGVVASMLAGYYHDQIDKLVLMAPAATLKDDAIKGICMDMDYDPERIPDEVLIHGKMHTIGGHYFRIAQTLPIYEVSSCFTGPALAIHGLNDRIVDPVASKRYNESMTDCRLIEVEGEDHRFMHIKENTYLEEIAQFINPKETEE